jgi:hypothetical protein
MGEFWLQKRGLSNGIVGKTGKIVLMASPEPSPGCRVGGAFRKNAGQKRNNTGAVAAPPPTEEFSDVGNIRSPTGGPKVGVVWLGIGYLAVCKIALGSASAEDQADDVSASGCDRVRRHRFACGAGASAREYPVPLLPGSVFAILGLVSWRGQAMRALARLRAAHSGIHKKEGRD